LPFDQDKSKGVFQLKKIAIVLGCVAALSATATVAASAQSTGPAAQQDTMSKDKMGKDAMKKDGMDTKGMAKDGMSKDEMSKMSKDGAPTRPTP
jgi:pentapeptide MXKDX repeat protein